MPDKQPREPTGRTMVYTTAIVSEWIWILYCTVLHTTMAMLPCMVGGWSAGCMSSWQLAAAQKLHLQPQQQQEVPGRTMPCMPAQTSQQHVASAAATAAGAPACASCTLAKRGGTSSLSCTTAGAAAAQQAGSGTSTHISGRANPSAADTAPTAAAAIYWQLQQ